MKTGAITYNQASGKLYKDEFPHLNETFKDETEAQAYLFKMGLTLHSTEPNPPPASQKQN